MSVAWERLIRFVSTNDLVLFGEPILPHPEFDLGNTTSDTLLQARVIRGDDIYDTTGITYVTDEIVTVKKLLGPLRACDVPIIRCVGLNYATHSLCQRLVSIDEIRLTNNDTVREAGRQVPPFPSIFFKPSTSVIGHDENVIVPKIAQDDQADYEGELVSLKRSWRGLQNLSAAIFVLYSCSTTHC